MKISVMGVKIVNGLTREEKRPFEISRLFCQVPIESGKFGEITILGFGYELAEMELDPSVINSFKEVKFPCPLTLNTEQRFYRGKFETVVIGFKVEMSKVA
jgi:hypothetical protein